MVTGEPVNISKVTQVVCDMERWLGAWITSFGDHTGLCDVKSWVRCVMGEIIVGLNPTSVIDSGGSTTYKVGAALTYQASLS
jgi:hypothetical protein